VERQLKGETLTPGPGNGRDSAKRNSDGSDCPASQRESLRSMEREWMDLKSGANREKEQSEETCGTKPNPRRLG